MAKGAYIYQQIELTTAEWAQNTTVYPPSVWLFERLENGKFNMKLTDGVHTFAELPYVMQDLQVTVKTNTATEYVLTITSAAGSFDTPNLKATASMEIQTLAEAPDETTLTYEDTSGTVVEYAIGQMVRVPSPALKSGYTFYQLADINEEGAAWQELGSGTSGSGAGVRMEQVGMFQNAGAGWNSYTFPWVFCDDVRVTLHPGTAWIRNITRSGFQYCLFAPDGTMADDNVYLTWEAAVLPEQQLTAAIATAAGLQADEYYTLAELFSAQNTTIAASPTAMSIVYDSSRATASHVCMLLSLSPASYSDVTALINNPIALAALVASESAMTAIAASSTAMTAIAASSTAMTAIAASSTAMTAIVASESAMTAIAASSTAMSSVAASAVAMNIILKSNTARTKIAESSYLQNNYDILLTTTNNTTYFIKKIDYVDNGDYRANSSGNKESSTEANQSMYLSIKIGSYSNGSGSTGTVSHMQNNKSVMTKTTSSGGGYNNDSPTSGGVEAKAICIGGVRFTESNDSYTRGYFVYAL